MDFFNINPLILLPLGALVILSFWIHNKLIKKSRFISLPLRPLNRPQEFKTLALRAFTEFFNPPKTYLWTVELRELLTSITFSKAIFTMWIKTLSEGELKIYWIEYDLILYWHINERKKLSESYEELNPELFLKEIDRLDAQINHRIMESFKTNPQLMIEINNFIFYESLKRKDLLK